MIKVGSVPSLKMIWDVCRFNLFPVAQPVELQELNRTVQGFITKDHSLNDVTVALHKGKDLGLEDIGTGELM